MKWVQCDKTQALNASINNENSQRGQKVDLTSTLSVHPGTSYSGCTNTPQTCLAKIITQTA